MATTIFGPRGCPAHEPENSPAGFRYALTHGAEGIETDLHLTKDGVPVIIHDETLHRTTNGLARWRITPWPSYDNFGYQTANASRR